MERVRDFLLDPCNFYTVIGILYFLDALTTWPSFPMALSLLFQVMSDMANSMEVRGAYHYGGANRCPENTAYFGSLMAVIVSIAGLIGLPVLIFSHFHFSNLGFLILPIIFYSLSIHRVRRIVRITRERREQELRESLMPGPVLHTLSLDRYGSPASLNRREMAKPRAEVSLNSPALGGLEPATSLRQQSDGPKKPEKSLAQTLRQHYYGDKKGPTTPFDNPQFPVLAAPSPTDFCCVCNTALASTGRQNLQLPVCGHWFHADCLTRFVAPAGECPVCQAAVQSHQAKAAQYRPHYPSNNYPSQDPHNN